MSNKQKYISGIEAKIAQLNKAKEGIAAIPDNIFDDIFETVFADLIREVNKPFAPTNPSPMVPEKNVQHQSDKKTYTQLVIEALKDAGRPLLKSELEDYFESHGVKNPGQPVTTALVGLQKGHKIKGFKPDGIKFKGLLWSLMVWWERGHLKREYDKLPPIFNE